MIVLELVCYAIIVALVLTIIILILQGKSKKEENLSVEKLKHIQYRFKEYIKFSPMQRLERFDILQKSLCKLYNLICREELHYDKRDLLYVDQLHSDISLIPYQNEKMGIDYFSPKSVLESIDLISNDKKELIDKYLIETCKKWLDEIPTIEALLKAKK